MTTTPQETAARPELGGTNATHLLIAGVLVWVTIGVGLILVGSWSEAQARAVLAGIIAELAAGREAGIPIGLSQGASPWLVWPASALQDLGTALVGYPIFLHLLHKYHDSDRYLMRRIRAIEAKAAGHTSYVHRWGPLGIGAFMLVPFLVNGPFIGLVLGRLSGIPTRRLLAPVIVATIVTAGIWTFFIDSLLRVLDAVHPQLGLWASFAGIGVVGILALVDFMQEQRRSRSSN